MGVKKKTRMEEIQEITRESQAPFTRCRGGIQEERKNALIKLYVSSFSTSQCVVDVISQAREREVIGVHPLLMHVHPLF